MENLKINSSINVNSEKFNVTFKTHDRNAQNANNIYWLNVENDVYGVSVINNGASENWQVIDDEGYPVEDGYFDELIEIVEDALSFKNK